SGSPAISPIPGAIFRATRWRSPASARKTTWRRFSPSCAACRPARHPSNNLTASVPDALVAFAEELADAAGVVIRRYFRRGVDIVDKPDLSPVTIADREAEAAIRQLVAARHPEHGIIGEEHGADRADAEFVWVVDPIDGTKGFTCGRPLF